MWQCPFHRKHYWFQVIIKLWWLQDKFYPILFKPFVLFIAGDIQSMIRFMWSIFSNTLTAGVLPLLVLTQGLHFHLATMVMLTFNTNVDILILESQIRRYFFPATAKISPTVFPCRKNSTVVCKVLFYIRKWHDFQPIFACMNDLSIYGWTNHIIPCREQFFTSSTIKAQQNLG